jgi:16S rRNA (guanine527-N7)-methyltransferase
MTKLNHSATDFEEALRAHSETYVQALSSDAIHRLSEYYQLLNAWNSRLHLVAPVSPQTFATRHILESLLLLEHLPNGARVVDIGSGGGLPIVPCLLVRSDLQSTLIEASKKKAVFLREAATQLHLSARATVIAERFQDVASPEVEFVTSRALERFKDQLEQIVSWSSDNVTFLLFGGEDLQSNLARVGLIARMILIPNSERRFLFIARKPPEQAG